MSCSCNSTSSSSPDGSRPALPGLASAHCPECSPSYTEPCCQTTCSSPSYGSALPNHLLGGYCAPANEGVTLLGRIGSRLAKFVGSGFVQVRDGKAYLISSVALSVRSLWHSFGISGSNTVATLGEPKDFPYGVVADSNGNLYGIMGVSSRRSVQVYNITKRQWEVLPVDQFPIEVSRKLAQANAIELTGFSPVSVSGEHSAVRPLKTLFGNGIVYLERTVTPGDAVPEGCPSCPGDGLTGVARVLEFPEIDPDDAVTEYQLVFSRDGLFFRLIP